MCHHKHANQSIFMNTWSNMNSKANLGTLHQNSYLAMTIYYYEEKLGFHHKKLMLNTFLLESWQTLKGCKNQTTTHQ